MDGAGAYHPLDLESAYAKLGERRRGKFDLDR